MGASSVTEQCLAIVSGTPPIHLLGRERFDISCGVDHAAARKQLMAIGKLAKIVGNGHHGKVNIRLTPEVSSWVEHRHREVTFHMSLQVLTGHGCFGAYLQRFNNQETDNCTRSGV